jgi:hypothetical protein
MAENYKHLYEQMKKMVAMYQDEIVPGMREQLEKRVEVVRCKDCKQWSRNSGIAESPNGHCFYHCIDTNGHDFCSYGERREGE